MAQPDRDAIKCHPGSTDGKSFSSFSLKLQSDRLLEDDLTSLDKKILLAFRSGSDFSDPLGPPWLEELLRDFTALGGVGVLTLLTISVIGFLLLAHAPRAASAVAIAILGGILISSLLKLGFDRPRPDLVSHGSVVYSSSFPSGHSLMAATVYLTLAAMLGRVIVGVRLRAYVITVAIVLAVLVGLSRIYLGVHWPTDVLAGWLVGASWALLWGGMMLQLQRSNLVEGKVDTGTDYST